MWDFLLDPKNPVQTHIRIVRYKGRFNEDSTSDIESTIEIDVNLTRDRDPDNFDVFFNVPNFYTAQTVPLIDKYKKYLRTPAAYCKKPLRW
jgi:hypothetical protein